LKPSEEQILWPNWRERRRELLDKAGFFDFMQRPAAAEWIRLLAEKVATKNSLKMLMKYLNEAFTAWGSDFAGNDATRRKKLRVVSEIILSSFATGKLDEEIRTMLPILGELRDNFDNLTPLGVAFAPFRRKGNYKMQFYGMCYHYQLFVEGIFDESIRLLFLLAASVKGKTASLRKVNKMDLWMLREAFRALGYSDLLFQGWKNRVRNSIAHTRFRYDERSRKMHFVDVDLKGKLPDYSEWFTLEEFSQLGRQLSDVYTIIQDVIFMMRIQQLVLTPELPRVNYDLLMPKMRKGVKEGLLRDPYS